MLTFIIDANELLLYISYIKFEIKTRKGNIKASLILKYPPRIYDGFTIMVD
jgi:hypothetical protein